MFDLCGAAIGCLLFTIIINRLGAPGGAMVNSLLCIFLSLLLLIFLIKNKSLFNIKVITIGGVIVVIMIICIYSLYFKDNIFVYIPYGTKSLGYALNKQYNPSVNHEYSSWDVVTKVDIISSNNKDIYIGWTKIPVKRKLITFDGDAISQISHYPNNFPTYKDINNFNKSDFHIPFFKNVKNGKHLIIGVGGGPDIARSLLLKAKSITGVEINYKIITAMKNHFSNFSGNIFNRPNVHIYHSEGRSYLKRSKERFDLIQMTGVDTFTALNTGAYVLAESYLYTIDAIKDYYNKLSDNGIICIHRWFYDNKPRESLKLFTTALQALNELGIKNPENYIAVIRPQVSGVTFISKKPFTEQDIDGIIKYLKKNCPKTKVIFLPYKTVFPHPASKYYYAVVTAFKNNELKKFYSKYDFNIAPATDDRPFFFNYYKTSKLFKSPLKTVLYSTTGPIQGYWPYLVMFLILLIAILSVMIFILLPLMIFKRDGLNIRGSLFLIIFFSSLGVGFIMIEITLMQKFALFLGHPMYSIASVTGGILIFAGLGSKISEGLRKQSALIIGTCVIILMMIIMIFFAKSIINQFLGYKLIYRILITLLLIAPLASSMGIFFPVGLKIVGEKANSFVPWAWGVNSATTVIGSIISIILAMLLGFNANFVVSSFVYILGVSSMFVYEKIR